MKKFLTGSISILIGIGIVSTTKANDLTKRIGIGLGNPYLSIKYGLNSKYSIEARGAFGSEITVGGARFYPEIGKWTLSTAHNFCRYS